MLQKGEKIKLLTLIIGCILAISLFVGNIVQAATNSGGGVGDLPTCWANVEVDNVRYDPVTQRTYSCHWYEILNYLDRKLLFTYEFTHGVREVLRRNNRGEVIQERFVGQSQTFLAITVNANDSLDQCGGQGISMSGRRPGQYEIKAYTAVRTAIQGGRLEVQTDDEVAVFWIFENE